MNISNIKLKTMKNFIYITLLVVSGSFFKMRAQTSIQSNIDIPNSRYSLQANTNYNVYLRAYVANGTSIQGFETTFDGEFPLKWKFNKFNKDEWVQLKHTFETTDALVNPVLKVELLSDDALGEGIGEFFIDDIRIVEDKKLDITPIVFEEKIRIYPNPIENGILYLNNLESLEKLTFFNLNGSLIRTVSNFNNEESNTGKLDLSFLRSGTYIMTITEGKDTTVKKIIIK